MKRNRERKTIFISQLGYFQRYKICNTCNIIRPLRTSHCGTCDNCILKLDHHCPWIGTCVGKRNYHYFFFFIVFLNLTQIFVGIFSIVFISAKIAFDVKDFKDKNLYKGKEIRVSFGNVVVAIWLICYVSISMIFTTGLLIYHIKIIKFDKTTREELKKLFVNPFLNPYERSTKQNLKNILLPNIKRTSIIDELKGNKIKYLKSIEESIKKKKGKENKMGDITDVSIEIESDENYNKKSKTKNKKEKKEFDTKKIIKKVKEKYKNTIPEKNSEENKINDKNNINNQNDKEKEKENIINKIISNEDKSSSNDIMTSHTNENNKNNFQSEQKISSLISPLKDEDAKEVKIVENNNIDSLPPPSNNNPDKGKKNKKGIFKRIFS